MTGFIYAISDGASRVKIGWSERPRRRFSEIRVHNASVRLIGVFPGTREREGEIHALLDAHRVSGEWFDLTALAVIRLLATFVEAPAMPDHCGTSDSVLRNARLSVRESQTQFAARFGVDQATLHRWETKGLPSRGPAKKLVGETLKNIMAEAAE